MQGAVAAVSHHQGRALPPQEVGRSGGAFPEVSRRSPWVSPTPAITGVASVRAEGERSQHSAQGLASTPKAPCPRSAGTSRLGGLLSRLLPQTAPSSLPLRLL